MNSVSESSVGCLLLLVVDQNYWFFWCSLQTAQFPNVLSKLRSSGNIVDTACGGSTLFLKIRERFFSMRKKAREFFSVQKHMNDGNYLIYWPVAKRRCFSWFESAKGIMSLLLRSLKTTSRNEKNKPHHYYVCAKFH